MYINAGRIRVVQAVGVGAQSANAFAGPCWKPDCLEASVFPDLRVGMQESAYGFSGFLSSEGLAVCCCCT